MSIVESCLYKKIKSNKFIYRAIYSLGSHGFEEDLLEEEDYKLMLKLKDPFNHDLIEDTIKKIEELIENVLLKDEFFELKVYFKPKKLDFNDKGNKIVEFRPIHSGSLITIISTVVLLNSLLLDTENDRVELSELSNMMPSNFYGNIPSENPKYLFKPWQSQFSEYTKKVTASYSEYNKTGEYKHEVSLDLKNFFPSINPLIIYDEILNAYSQKYDDEIDIECLKIILTKLLFFKITNLKTPSFKKIYYDKVSNSKAIKEKELFSKGIPQGLPHAYFFGNICMKIIYGFFKKIIIGEDGKSYFYVDDSVIYTNVFKELSEEKVEESLNEKIKKINKELKVLSNEVYKKHKEVIKIDFLKNIKYEIQIYDTNDEKSKSNIIEIKNPKYGQFNLIQYSKKVSGISFNFNKIFLDSEEINILKKIEILHKAIENEITRIDTIKNTSKSVIKDINEKSYLKILIRMKKFFKYRYKILEYKNKNEIETSEVDDLLSIFDVSNNEKIKEFFEAYDEDIVQTQMAFLFKNKNDFGEKIKDNINKLNKEIYGKSYLWEENGKQNTFSYFEKIFQSMLIKNNITVDNNITIYDSIKKYIKKTLKVPFNPNKGMLENKIREAIDDFETIFKNHKKIGEDKKLYVFLNKCRINEKDGIYNLINIQKDDLYRIVINTYFSELLSIEINDLKHFSKLTLKPLYSNEVRLILFLRNKQFSLEDFFITFRNFKNGEPIDYTIFEVVNYFEMFIKNPVYVDSLILLHKYTADIWKNGSKYLHFYTLHNQEHAIEVIKSIIAFLKTNDYFKLSSKNFYILFMSCYLHDISMVQHPNLFESFLLDNKESSLIYSEFKKKIMDILNIGFAENFTKKLLVDFFKKLDEYYETYIRQSHPKESAKFIRSNSNLSYIDDTVKEIVAEISQAHGYDVDEIYKIKSNAKDELISKKYLKILLRIGDLLDVSSNRVNDAILKNNKINMNLTNQFHWISHKSISNIEIVSNYEFVDESLGVYESWLDSKRILEIIEFCITLNVKHEVGISEKNKNCYKVEKDNQVFTINFDEKESEEKVCLKCNFMCKWMKVKNDYLYKELNALQVYLNSLTSDLFHTKINIKYKFNDNPKKLSSEEFEIISSYIENKR